MPELGNPPSCKAPAPETGEHLCPDPRGDLGTWEGMHCLPFASPRQGLLSPFPICSIVGFFSCPLCRAAREKQDQQEPQEKQG